MEGFLSIDKPQGITSFDVIRKLRKILPRNTKIGHLGTLDPMATGVLPIAIGKATRVIEYIRDEKKIYTAELTLGAVSDTEDATGSITYTDCKIFDKDKLINTLNSFVGNIEQVPPMYSAIHHEGKRLYEWARQGINIDRPSRRIEIFSIELLSIRTENILPQITIEVFCSKGTYIRSLCRDIGEKLGTGAYLSGLIRKQSGVFTISDAFKLEEIMDNPSEIEKKLYPIDYPLEDLRRFKLSSMEEEKMLTNGRALKCSKNIGFGIVAVYSKDNNIIAIGEALDRKNGIFIYPKKVFKYD